MEQTNFVSIYEGCVCMSDKIPDNNEMFQLTTCRTGQCSLIVTILQLLVLLKLPADYCWPLITKPQLDSTYYWLIIVISDWRKVASFCCCSDCTPCQWDWAEYLIWALMITFVMKCFYNFYIRSVMSTLIWNESKGYFTLILCVFVPWIKQKTVKPHQDQ